MIFDFFMKNKKQEEEKTDITMRVEDMMFHIISDTVKLSKNEAEAIVKIIRSETVETRSKRCGYIVAQRICEEINQKICTADVDGGKDGKEWLIKISSNPLEFID
jgi:hypothetical protein